jgi:hypothetical protein
MEYELTPEAIELGLGVTLPAVHDLGQKREFGRGERSRAAATDLNVPELRLWIAVAGAQLWPRSA